LHLQFGFFNLGLRLRGFSGFSRRRSLITRGNDSCNCRNQYLPDSNRPLSNKQGFTFVSCVYENALLNHGEEGHI